MLKTKDGYKLELQTLAMMKLFGITNKLIDRTKNLKTVPSVEVVEKVQWNLVDDKYQQTLEVLHNLTPKKSYKSLLKVEPNSLVVKDMYFVIW